AQETLARIQELGGSGTLLAGDLTAEEQAVAAVGAFRAAAGRLDILVNNAGSPVRFTRIEDCPTALWREVFGVNLTSAFLVTRQAIPHLRASGRGSIVNNLSLSVQTGGAGGAGPDAAVQGALQSVNRTPAPPLAPRV